MISRILTRTFVLLSLIAICAGQTRAAGIEWQPDWSSAVAQSSRTNKMILVDFYTDWCGWCKKLDADVYPKPAVISTVAQFVPVRLNAEKAGKELAERYQVNGYPTILILDSSGNVVDRCAGYMKPKEFVGWLNEVLHGGDASGSAAPSDGAANDTPSNGVASDTDVPKTTTSHNASVIHMSRIRETTKFVPTYQGDPIEAAPTMTLAQKYLDRGDAAGAGRVAVKVAHGGGTVPAAFYSKLGDAALRGKKTDAAWGWFQLALKTAKSDQDIAYAQLQSARTEMALGSLTPAKAHLKALTESAGAPAKIKSEAQSLLDGIGAPATR
ncbi:hypothetical protein CCAX7_46060 [Capsulimonas corticalis]|uniref:Uncharacterized protein n=1 Tax=Capsulimonas corticalis TaxID=2219043 RepID=A0A402D537_9BACT|nr:thioredoxin fold domain-containing protein [Capsulimonas corticalis]BDI32555.1 hypothetical protein CCAX7_46060 [Capsulimonas corticalis]